MHNRSAAVAELYVRHAVSQEWALRPTQLKYEKMGGAYLFPVQVPAHGSLDVVIEESMPILKTIDIRADTGIDAIELYLRTAKLEGDLKAKLDEVVRLHKQMKDKQAKIENLEAQMQVLRTRVDEIHLQLVTLRQVPNAQALSKNLAQKMET